MAAQLRVGVIGCGRIALEQHLPAYRALAEDGLARLVGVSDVEPGRAERAAAPYGVPAFGSAAELIEAARPEVVSVATHPSSHRDLVGAALAAGCHVLCEKPIAIDLAEAHAMVAAAERAGRLLSVCFEYRYWDESLYLRDRIARGGLGHIHHVRTWGGAAGGFPESPNFHRREIAGGGVLTHWTIHNLDLALWLLAASSPEEGSPEPLSASAFGHQRLPHTAGPRGVDPAVEDFAFGFVRLEGGTAVTVEANWLQPPSSRPEGWELLGDRGAASLSPIRVWLDRDGAWVDDTPPPGTLAPCDYDMTRLIGGFLERVRDGGPAPVSAGEILRIQALMDALYASMASGREVAVDTSRGL
ncbi:MAG TPA: Gfo/Idh/MocA family oxidoreductase [Chloroflexota bacterium]|nr:Gfo/Idh/MocA family oxidoreductase [Chloroflexota bacterium]